MPKVRSNVIPIPIPIAKPSPARRRAPAAADADAPLAAFWRAMLSDAEEVAASCLAWARATEESAHAVHGAALALIAEHLAATGYEITPQALQLLASAPLPTLLVPDASVVLCWTAAVIGESYGIWPPQHDSASRIRAQVELWLREGEPFAAAAATLAPDLRLIWGCAIAQWCERNGRNRDFAHVAAQVIRRADHAPNASPWCRGHWRVAASWHDAAFGRNRDARRILEEAQALALRYKLPRLGALVSLQQARRAAGALELDRAAALATAVLTATPGEHAPLWVADAEEVLCRVALLRGDARAGLAHARRALGWADAARAPASAMLFYEAHEAYALSACGAYDASVERTRCWSAATLPPFLRERCVAIATWLSLIQQEHAGAWSGTQIAELASAVQRLRELEWLSLLPTLPNMLARLWARALANGEPQWLCCAIVQRDLPPPADGPYAGLEVWPWQIRIRVLGTFALTGKSVRAMAERQKGAAKPLALLRLIAVQRERDGIGVEQAADILWPGRNRDDRMNALEVTLGRLRKALGSADAVVLQHHRLHVNPQRVWLDLHALERVLAAWEAGDAARSPQLWKQVLPLWGGALLAQEDDVWISPARDRVRALLAAVLAVGGDAHERRARRARALTIDPGMATWWSTDT